MTDKPEVTFDAGDMQRIQAGLSLLYINHVTDGAGLVKDDPDNASYLEHERKAVIELLERVSPQEKAVGDPILDLVSLPPDVTPTQVAAVGHMRDALIKVCRLSINNLTLDEARDACANALAHAGIDLSQGPDATT